MSTIGVERRAGGYIDRGRKYKVLVDGEPRGKVGAGEDVVIEVAAGSHEVQLKIDWARSPVVSVEVAEGQDVRLSSQPAATLFSIFFYITFARDRYIKLYPVQH